MLAHGYSENYVSSISVTILHVTNDSLNLSEVAKLTGSKFNQAKPSTDRELYMQALNQDLLKRIVVIKMKKPIQFAKKGTLKA